MNNASAGRRSAVTTPEITPGERRSAAIAVAAGTAIEYFDWAVYATFAVYFAPLMFNATDPTSALLQSAVVFAAGYLLRPFGALLLGKISDRRGRKPALTVSVVAIIAAALLIALTPTYAQVGVLASVILALARIVQGLAYGGEFGTVAATLREIAPPGRRGRFSSVFVIAAAVGQITGFLVLIALQTLLTRAQMSAFGWRIPFGVALLGALVVVYLRRRMVESPVFSEAHRSAPRKRGSLRQLFATQRVPVLLCFLAVALTVPTLLTFGTYIQKFGINSLGLDPRSVSYAVLFVLALFGVSCWLWGVLADRVGPATLLCVGFAGTAVLPVPAYYLMAGMGTASSVAIGAGAVLLFCAMSGAAQQTVLASLLPPHLRALGVGLAHAVALAVFGGVTELVALSFKTAGHESWHFWLLFVLGAAALAVGLKIRRRADTAPVAAASADPAATA